MEFRTRSYEDLALMRLLAVIDEGAIVVSKPWARTGTPYCRYERVGGRLLIVRSGYGNVQHELPWWKRLP